MSRHFSPTPPEEPNPRGCPRAQPIELAEQFELLDLEHSELDRRLRNMEWPTAPPEVKERVLRAVLARAANGFPGLEADEPAGDPGPTEQVDRFELSRFSHDVLANRVLKAPRRQPRYASVL